MTLVFQSFLSYVLSTKVSFHILFSSASHANLSQEGLWWTEGSCSGASIITSVANKGKHASTQKYFIGVGNLRSRMVYIIFLTHFLAAYNQGWLTIK